MIKLFFSHVCADVTDQLHGFLNWVTEKMKRDLRQFEPFIACKSGDWNNTAELNGHLDQSQFFIPVITDPYSQRPNCTAELERARNRKNSSGGFPMLLPLKFGCNGNTMQSLGFQIDMRASQGELWIDFSEPKDWEVGYATLCEHLTQTALKHRLLGDDNFYKDCEHLDLILKRDKPTAFEIKAVIDLCRMGEEYGQYFFGGLDRKEWLDYLRPRGFFKGNPAPVQSQKQTGFYSIPYWPVLGYLERISKECSKPENHTYAEALMEIIRDATRPADGEKVDNYRTWWVFAKIMANLPTDVIKLEDIALVGDWLESQFDTMLIGTELGGLLMPKLLQSGQTSDWEKATKLVEIITRIRWRERQHREGGEHEARTAIDSHSLTELFQRNARLLGERCGRKIVQILTERLREVLAEKDDQYSYIWRPAIEDHGQNIGGDRTRNVLISALRDVVLSHAQTRHHDAKETLSSLLGENWSILKRIALYVVNQHYGGYRELFWNSLGPSLFSTVLHHELFELLRCRFKEFSSEEQERVIEIIDGLTEDWRDGTDKQLFDAKVRLDWLEAIRSQGNGSAEQLYNRYLATAKHPSEHPEFTSYMETGWGETGPCSVDELLRKSTSDIVKYLNEFKGSGRWKTPTEEGLADVLRDAVKQQPDKFEPELSAFLEAPLRYQYAVLRAFEERWKAKQPIDWEKVLAFCWSILEPDAFWEQLDQPREPLAPTRSWINSIISSLIEAGVENDEWAFGEVYLPLAEKILLRILEKEPPTAEGKDEDALTEAMNTSKGRCLMALFNYALRQARLADDKQKEHQTFWVRIQPIFDQELEQCRGKNFEFSALAGVYLPNLWYLSKMWVEAHLDGIFSTENEQNWRCAIQGYAYVGKVYHEIYTLLKRCGHLDKAFITEFKNRHIREKLVQNIAVAYLSTWESLTGLDSLFAKVVQGWEQEDIQEIISFFWMSRDAELDEQTRGLILDFWRECHQKIRGREKEHAAILSSLSLLTVFLTAISDEQKTWILQSAPYVDENHHSAFFLEYLKPLTSHAPEAMADIYLAMLTKTIPTYKEDDIRSIVGQLYEAGLQEKANAICATYARKGYPDFLRNLYTQHNS